MSTTVPFTPLEEAVFHIEQKYTPWNIQLEVETKHRIDIERLREAARTACGTHPLSRARKQPHEGWSSQYVWEIPDTVEEIPVEEFEGESPDELPAAQTAFYGQSFDLSSSPPFRLLVARGAGVDGGDRLLVNVSHIPADGVGTLRLVQSICQAYRGVVPEEDPVDLETSREVFDDIRPSAFGERLGLLGSAASKLENTVDQPARIAEDGAIDQPGWGFVHRTLDAELTERVIENRPEDASVNDMLLAALHLTIDEWNRQRGDTPDKISLMMPVNLRPREWFYEVVGMYALFESVTTKPKHRRNPTATVERVVEQTTEIKEQDRAAAFLESLDLIPGPTPVGLKRQLPELLQGPGEGLLDTAMLSNLGRVPEPLPALDDDGPGDLWFSPPCWEPTPVSIGVVTVDGTIQLVFRHMFTTMDRSAAEDFADGYVDALELTVK